MPKYRLIATLFASAALTAIATPAFATDTPAEYVTVAWVIDNPADIWHPAQRTSIDQTVTGAAVDFAGAQALVACGKFYQIDGYKAGPTTDALIAGGVLYGPSNPAEDLAYNAPGTESTSGTPWVYYQAPDCSETVCISENQIRTYTFRYTWDGAAPVRTETTSISATLTEADAITAGCYVPPVVDPLPPADPPVVAELAHAGPVTLWMVPLAGVLLLIGGLCIVRVEKLRKEC